MPRYTQRMIEWYYCITPGSQWRHLFSAIVKLKGWYFGTPIAHSHHTAGKLWRGPKLPILHTHTSKVKQKAKATSHSFNYELVIDRELQHLLQILRLKKKKSKHTIISFPQWPEMTLRKSYNTKHFLHTTKPEEQTGLLRQDLLASCGGSGL